VCSRRASSSWRGSSRYRPHRPRRTRRKAPPAVRPYKRLSHRPPSAQARPGFWTRLRAQSNLVDESVLDGAYSLTGLLVLWLASCFDILFAVNRVLHPGEKRLLEFAARECPVVPEDLSPCLVRLLRLATQAAWPLLDTVDELTDGLEVLIRREHVLMTEMFSGLGGRFIRRRHLPVHDCPGIPVPSLPRLRSGHDPH